MICVISYTDLLCYTIQRFRQASNSKTLRQTSVMLNQGISWREIPKNATTPVDFQVDLASVVRFSDLNIKSKKLEIMAGAKVEVDAVSGKKIGKKVIRLIKGERFGLLKMMDKRFIVMIVDHGLNVKREGSAPSSAPEEGRGKVAGKYSCKNSRYLQKLKKQLDHETPLRTCSFAEATRERSSSNTARRSRRKAVWRLYNFEFTRTSLIYFWE
ncbi:hypothetical protein ACET3Z_023617 [Daucus carota]